MQTQSCDFGVVPFENSTNGNVVFTLDLFRDRHTPAVHVVAETYLDVHHCFLSTSAEIQGITRIYSHPQAFGQCETWLNSMVKGRERIDVSSTSRAAQMALEEPGSAAIASSIAANVLPLKVLARNIEDSPDNTTRFLILSATPEKTPPRYKEGDEAELGNKTFVAFTVDHEQPGALCDGLKVFKDCGLNLTSIASRPSRKRPWNYVFFVEFEGERGSAVVNEAVEKLKGYCVDSRVLGGFKDRQKGRLFLR